MPVILPKLSRREFLKRAALAGAAAAFAPKLYAELSAKPGDPDTFFLISDTHIAADAAAWNRGVNMADNLSACIRELAAWPVKPAAVIVNGDLALKEGLPEEYTGFGKSVEPLRALAPLHLSLGNHDQRENFWNAFPRDAAKSKTVPPRQTAFFPGDRANWFLLDSLDITNKTPGELGSDQLSWLAHELDLRPQKPALVVVHHDPQFPTPTSGLRDTAALMEMLAPRRQVKALIFGHTHDWHIASHASGIHLINLPPTSYLFKQGRPNGWVRCTLAGDSAEFELRSLDAKHPEHAQVKKLEWRA